MSIMVAETSQPIVRAGRYCDAHPNDPLILIKRVEESRTRITLIVEVSVCESCKDFHDRTVDDGKFKFQIQVLKDGEDLISFHQGFYTPFEGRKWLNKVERVLPDFLFTLRASYLRDDRTLNKLFTSIFDQLKELSEQYPRTAATLEEDES